MRRSPSTAALEDEANGRGYTVGIAATILGRTPADVASYYKQGRIHRWRQRVSHAQKVVCWFYSQSDVNALVPVAGRPFEVKKLVDLTKRYLKAVDAARLLGVSMTTIYALASRHTGVRIRTLPKCRFKFPTKSVATGYYLADVMAIKHRREATELTPAFVEEIVDRSTIARRLKIDLAMVQPSDLFAANARGELTAEETVDRLRNLLLRAA